jgi:hypothetical protein
LQQLPGPVSAAVVYNDDFVRNVVKPQLNVKVFNGGTYASLLVPRRDDDGKQGKRL